MNDSVNRIWKLRYDILKLIKIYEKLCDSLYYIPLARFSSNWISNIKSRTKLFEPIVYPFLPPINRLFIG